MDAKQVQQLIGDLECPVCSDIMESPIRTCIVGHSFCNNCFTHVSACPLCRGEMKGDRNYTLEDIGRSIIFKCNNKSKGCDFEAQIDRINQHNKFCQYTLAECPLKLLDHCRWTGRTQDIMDHCFNRHPNNSYSAKTQKLMCKDFLNVEDVSVMTLKHYYIICEAYGQKFKIMWDLNCESGFMLWRAIYYGPDEEAVKYRFSLDFHNPHDPEDKLHLEGKCQPTELKKVTSINMYIATKQKRLVDYCVGKDLFYTISIIKASEEEEDKDESCDKNVPSLYTFVPESSISRL